MGLWGSERSEGERREWVRGREKRESDGWRRGERAERMSEEGGRVKREKRCIGSGRLARDAARRGLA